MPADAIASAASGEAGPGPPGGPVRAQKGLPPRSEPGLVRQRAVQRQRHHGDVRFQQDPHSGAGRVVTDWGHQHHPAAVQRREQCGEGGPSGAADLGEIVQHGGGRVRAEPAGGAVHVPVQQSVAEYDQRAGGGHSEVTSASSAPHRAWMATR